MRSGNGTSTSARCGVSHNTSVDLRHVPVNVTVRLKRGPSCSNRGTACRSAGNGTRQGQPGEPMAAVLRLPYLLPRAARQQVAESYKLKPPPGG